MSRSRVLTGLLALVILLSGLGQPFDSSAFAAPNVASVTDEGEGDSDSEVGVTDPDGVTDAIAEADRAAIIGSGWQNSDDTAVIGAGDSYGFHIYRASAAEGYAWRRVATLSAFGVETDMWIGNVCTTVGGDYAGVVYAPRGVVNDEWYFSSGARAAVVDLTTGEVTDLGVGFSMAYYNPGCGSGSSITFSRFADGATDVAVYDAEAGAAQQVVNVPGQLTSPLLVEDTLVGAFGSGIVAVNEDGSYTELAETQGTAYDLTVGDDGVLAFLERSGESASASTLSLADLELRTDVAAAALTDLGLDRTGDGSIVILGEDVDAGILPNGVDVIEGSAHATISSGGAALLDPPTAVMPSDEFPSGEAIEVGAQFIDSGETLTFELPLDGVISASDSPTTPTVLMSVPQNPVDLNRTCAVPRNDPQSQALQPMPRQVEWAANLAVQGLLTIDRPANHNGWGLPAYTPQGMFPRIPLDGGGRIPVQILLGVLAQESNLWQAARFATPGQMANPLIGNFYGINTSGSASDPTFWYVNFPAADCGYGVGQITDGMRLAGKELPGGVPAYPVNEQRAIALDYTANVAMATRILADKWNQTRGGGLTINNGHPDFIENWFFAVWAYNTGYYPEGAPGQPWGVGWSNNPINPIYPANRGSFLDGSPGDAATPQQWPYPERVMGFAAHGLELIERQSIGSVTYVQAFRTAWWPGAGSAANANRTAVKPPAAAFCDQSVNDCLTTAAQPCQRSDFQCWWNGNVTWKLDCGSHCGREFMRFSPAASYMNEQANGTSWPPSCTRSGLPQAAVVVDNLPLSTGSSSLGSSPRRCGSPVATNGSFSFNFGQSLNGTYPNAIDLHQLGGGLNEHFYFSRMWGGESVPKLTNGQELDPISGTWSYGQNVTNQWMRIWVHTPDHGAWSQQAVYEVQTANGPVHRTLQQRTYANSWQELGSFLINGEPTVTLTNRATATSGISGASGLEEVGIVDVAWDAVAFEPLAGAPADVIVSIGDSYSSGEGSPGPDPGRPYWPETDNLGTTNYRNGCHRSDNSWPQQLVLGSSTNTLRQRQQAFDPTLSFRQVACSGAVTDGVLTDGSFGEAAQLAQGYLDESTTLVALTLGGNDVGFAWVLNRCVIHGATSSNPNQDSCKDVTHSNHPGQTLEQYVDANVLEFQTRLLTVLRRIHDLAPNAEILLLGYPPIFDDGVSCTPIAQGSQNWLESVAQDIDAAQASVVTLAQNQGVPVHFQSLSNDWNNRGVCGSTPGITPMITYSSAPTTSYGTTGEVPAFYAPPLFEHWVSQQSFHPNNSGSAVMASVASNAIATFY